MDGGPPNKRARRTEVVRGGGKLSALERLHPDALEAVLQLLGPAEASRVRLVSKRMRQAVDGVAGWKSLRLEARSVAQLERQAARVAPDQPQLQPQPPSASSSRSSRSTRRSRSESAPPTRFKLAAGSTLELVIRLDLKQTAVDVPAWHKAVSALVSACSASSGGLGGLSMTASIDVYRLPRRRRRHRHTFESSDSESEDSDHGYSDCYTTRHLERLVLAALVPLSSPQADGGSLASLKSVSVELDGDLVDPCDPKDDPSVPHDLLQLLSRFPALERLDLPYFFDRAAATLSTALPALRAAVLRLGDRAALPLLARHPALEELDVASELGGGTGTSLHYFKLFAEGHIARRLRRLSVGFAKICMHTGFRWTPQLNELSPLRLLTSLEVLQLMIAVYGAVELDEQASDLGAHISGLQKLRRLDLIFHLKGCTNAAVLARTFATLSERAGPRLLVALALCIEGHRLMEGAALVAALRAAGPILVDLDLRDSLAMLPRVPVGPAPHAPLRPADVGAALAACPRLRTLRLLEPYGGPEPRGWLPAALAGLRTLCELDLDFGDASLAAADLRGLAGGLAALCGHSLVVLRLTLVPSVEPDTDAALAELLRASAPALAELRTEDLTLEGEVAEALAACARLQRLDLSLALGRALASWEGASAKPAPLVSLEEVVGALASCPRLEEALAVPVAFANEREAGDVLRQLRRLAAACPLLARCRFLLRPYASLRGEKRHAAKSLVEQHIQTVFPSAEIIREENDQYM